MPSARLAQLKQAIAKRSDEQLLRTPVTLQQYSGRMLRVAGVSYLNFSGNDYLGLATDAEVLQAYADGARDFGAGSTGSPLVTGQHQVHARLCDILCDWLGTEQAMLFSSGFAANQTMLQTLAQKGDTLVLDKLSHASLIDGALHSDAVLKRFGHNDNAQLDVLLQNNTQPLVVTEGVFSMDGDRPNLNAMLALCKRYDAPLLLDDAHGIGVSGPEGSGTAPAQGISNAELFCLMANFGKALGVGGAFIAGSKTVIDYLTQFGRHYVYSTALSPALCAAVIKSIALCRSQQWRRDKLHSNIALFRHLAADLPLLVSESAIQGVVLGSNERALTVSQQLKANGIWLSAMRSPTVAKGSERLRITLSAQHSDNDIKQLVQQLRPLL